MERETDYETRNNRSSSSNDRQSSSTRRTARHTVGRTSSGSSRSSRQSDERSSRSSRRDDADLTSRSSRQNDSDRSSRSSRQDGTNRSSRSSRQSDERSTRSSRQGDRERASRSPQRSASDSGARGTSSRTSARHAAGQTATTARSAASPSESSASASATTAVRPPKGLPIAAVLLVIVLVAAIVGAVFVLGQNQNGGQAASSAAESAGADASASLSSTSMEADETQLEPDTAALNKLLGKETAAKLIEQAKTNADAGWIASHVDAYAIDGDEAQKKILKLAAEDPKALPYVRQFTETYPEKKADMSRDPIVPESSFKGTKFETEVPHLFQWDNRWGQTVYSSTTFGLTGCGPTSMAMAYQGVTGKTDLSPYDMGEIAQEHGYMAEFNGTGSGFFYFVAAQNDFSCTDLPISGENITSALESGQIIIANLAEGYFTEHGHFFVLTGLDSDGKVIINDPYSYERSTQTWDADFIANESMALFAFSSDPYPTDGYGYW